MNKTRRARIAAAVEELRAIRTDEEDARFNLPESFQDGKQGERMQDAIDTIDGAIDDLEALLDPAEDQFFTSFR